MNFIRKIINSDILEKVVRLPEELRHQKVEILIFPVLKQIKKTKKNFNPKEYSGIIKIDDIDNKIKILRDEWDR